MFSLVQAVAGVFYVYAYEDDFFRVIENQNLQSGSEYMVVDRDATVTNLFLWLHTASEVWFNDRGEPGANPCWNVPVRTTSWGRMKRRY